MKSPLLEILILFLPVTDFDFPSVVGLGFFPGAVRLTFLRKPLLASGFQSKNLMTETFFIRQQLTDIILYYRFPRRIIHGKYNVLPILVTSHFFKIQINAVRTWNKLFFQNVRSAICSHYTILLSKE